MKNFAERVKLLRKQKKITQTAMADFLGCTEQHYQRIEYGKVNLPSSDLIALADYFGVSIDYLVGKADDPRADSTDYIGESVLGYGVNPVSDLLNAVIRIKDAQTDSKEKEKWEIRLGTLLGLVREHQAGEK